MSLLVFIVLLPALIYGLGVGFFIIFLSITYIKMKETRWKAYLFSIPILALIWPCSLFNEFMRQIYKEFFIVWGRE